MLKILCTTLLALTLVSAEDVNAIQINDGTKPKIDLMAEIMKLHAREKLLDREIEMEKIKTEAQKKELASAIELGKTLDELKDTLVTKQEK